MIEQLEICVHASDRKKRTGAYVDLCTAARRKEDAGYAGATREALAEMERGLVPLRERLRGFEKCRQCGDWVRKETR